MATAGGSRTATSTSPTASGAALPATISPGSTERRLPDSIPGDFGWTMDILKTEILGSIETILKFLAERGLIKLEGKLCNVCKQLMRLVEDNRVPEGVKFRCRKKGGSEPHDISRSIRDGTWFQDMHLSFGKALLLTYMWCKRYDQEQVRAELGIARQTAVDWFNFHREAVADVLFRRSEPIGGPGKVVEVDKSKFGKRKYHRGKRVEGQWVLGGVERGSRAKMFLVPVEKRNADTLIPILKEWIRPGSTVITDGWRAYDVLGEEGYTHLTVNHSLHFKCPESGAHTNTVEGNWAHAKKSLPKYGVKKEFIGGYLSEYIWRTACKADKKDPFDTFLSDIVWLYDQIKDEKDKKKNNDVPSDEDELDSNNTDKLDGDNSDEQSDENAD